MHQGPKIKNILLLSVEDLNDWIEPLGGHPQAVTPNLTRLANRSTVFENAFAAAPACSPSRTSTLFGQAPWRTGIYANHQSWSMAFPEKSRTSIIGTALNAGWETIGAGKVFHMGPSGFDNHDWTDFFHTEVDQFSPLSKAMKAGWLGENGDFGPIPNDAPQMADERNLAYFKTQLTPDSQNKFWAFGTYRPHLPFIAPQRFFDMIETPVGPPPSFHGKAFDANDLTEFNKLPKAARRNAQRRVGQVLQQTGEYEDFVHSYLASIAYADFIVGEILDQLEESGLMDSTMILCWSDHGLQFGEKLAFKKFTLWERALRVPLMIAMPGGTPSRITEPVSLLDIYPTLLNILGAEAPHALDGQDLIPIVHGEPGRGSAPSMWERYEKKSPNTSQVASSIRTEQYRLIRYDDGSLEMYDHGVDPFEKDNLINDEVSSEGSNIEKLCFDLMQLLPQNPKPPLPVDALPDDLTTYFPRDSGKKLII